MEMLLIYFAKSSALLSVFFLVYHFLLRKETFFKSSRWYLLFGLVISVALPLVTFKKIVWVEAQKEVDWSTIPQTVSYAVVEQPETFEINWFFVTIGIYGIGMAIFLLKFFFDFHSLAKLLKGKTIKQQEDYKFLDVSDNVSPFSYFNYIVYNSSLYSESELRNILEHEKVHSNQNHTIDVLISRIFCIVFWYNPFIWLYKKAILQNLEFIADSEASKNVSDIKAYQRTLLKITTHDCCVAITNHFYQSLIKKRIVMLNKDQSKKRNSWKYAIVIPALIAFMLYFQVQMIAQERQEPKVTVVSQDEIEVMINKHSTDAELKYEVERAKKEGINLKFSKIKRNKDGEITAIKAEFKDKDGNSGTTQLNSDEPIKPFRFSKNDESVGFGNSTIVHAYAISTDDSENSVSRTYINGEKLETPKVPKVPNTPNMPNAPETPEAPAKLTSLGALEETLSKSIAFNTNNTNGNVTYVIDGEIIELDAEKILSELDPNMIEKIKVIKSDFSNGVKNKNGVIYIDTKKITKEALKLAEESIKKARIEIERSKPEIERSKREIELSKPEIEKAREEIKKAKIEIQEAKIEMQKAKAEMEKAKAEIEKAKADYKKDKK